MTPLPLHRVATAMPFINYLQQRGLQLEAELRRARLPVMAMYDPDCFIPSMNYWNFIADVAEHEQIKDLGFLVGLNFGADLADKGLAKKLARLPTLHIALDQFCKIATSEISQVSLWLEPADKNTHRLHYRPSYGRDHPAYVHFQWYGLIASIAAIHLFTGTNWQPRQIGLGTTTRPKQSICRYFPNTRFHTGQQHCFISLNNRLLGNPPQADEDLLQLSPHYASIKVPRDFIGRLKLALRSYLRDGAPSLKLAADICYLSTRTLQRQLAIEGLTYKDLLAEVRYETAIDYMQSTDKTITEITSLLGYSDPTHFARAFRRTAGVSPREQLRQYRDRSNKNKANKS